MVSPCFRFFEKVNSVAEKKVRDLCRRIVSMCSCYESDTVELDSEIPRPINNVEPLFFGNEHREKESVRSRVAMDFTGAVGRIVEDPQEATAIAAAEGYSWKRRWRSHPRGTTAPPTLVQTQTAYVHSIDTGIHMTQPWFHSGLPRDQAAELVARHGSVDGVFLVRDSRSNPGSYVITYKCGGKVIHAQVNPILDPLRDKAVYSIDNGATKFYDLLQLVEFYQLNAGCLPTRLTHYITFLLDSDRDSETIHPNSNTSGSSN